MTTVLTSYKQRRINNKVNLLTGTSEVTNSVSVSNVSYYGILIVSIQTYTGIYTVYVVRFHC